MKILSIIGKVGIGICIYGVYRKSYDLGCDYIKEDVASIANGIIDLKESIIEKRKNA